MNSEQREQLQHVINALAADLYIPLDWISFSGFRAEAPLSLSEAENHEREPFPEGKVWGQPRDYAWMFATLIFPERAEGERIVMDLNPGGESTLFVDGKAFGSRRADRLNYPHHYIVDQTLSMKAEKGEKHMLALEAYAGTPLPAYCGQPLKPEEEIPFVRTEPASVGHSTFGIWNEEAYQLWLDLTMLSDLYRFMDDDDAMKEQISVHIGRMLDETDFELPLPERRKAYIKAREILSPVMNAHNGTFAPQMGVIANSHLDFAWLWPIRETRRKTARTFAAQLRLLKEYPEALFLQSQCAEYELCRKYYPELFSEIKEAIKSGRWIAEGGMWVEPDTNLAGGEALIRQFLYGKKYFREVLDTESKVAWLPDTFGYSAALPQIIRGFSMTGLTTQKIFWSYNDSERFPHHAFMWRGMDGTCIPSYLHMFYETQVEAKTLNTRWKARIDRDGSGDFYLPFGYGDGGGGPTRDDMEQIRRQRDLQGSPRLYWMHPGDYLEKRNNGQLPEYRGELYFPCHRGTYTTQAAIKKGNRRCENALRTWEMLASVAAYTGRAAYPKAELERVWKELLINQFHDILPGSAINEVYKEAREAHRKILADAKSGIRAALAALKDPDSGNYAVTVFNPATHAGRRMLHMPDTFSTGAKDKTGRLYPAQRTENGVLVQAELPALSSVTLTPAAIPACAECRAEQTDDGYLLKNSVIIAKIGKNGELLSLIMNGKERISSPSNVLHLYRDLPRKFDAWDIDSQTENREVFPERECSSRILSESGLRAALQVEIRMGASSFTQVISLEAGSDMLLFDTSAEWHECHKLLKVSFDTGIPADEAAHQIQFGFLDRPAHRSRRFDADRFEVCAHAWSALRDATHGAALLNDCKYGVGVSDGVISLSLLRAPTYPDAEADRGTHTFRYAYRAWDGSMESACLNASAEELNVPAVTEPGAFSVPRLFDCADPAVCLESVKLAEDGSGDMILRLYESQRGERETELRLNIPFSSAFLCDMEENRQCEIPAENGSLKLRFHPFSIITLRIAH